jgi:pilus assembly protein CpaC
VRTEPFGYPALALTLLAATALNGQNRGISASAVNISVSAASQENLSDAMSVSNAGGEVLHLTIGRSMFVTTTARLRRVYINNPAVLDSYTANPRQLVITAKAAGLGTVVLWDENGLCQSYPLSVDVDVDGLRKDMTNAFPNEAIRVESQGSTISLAGTVPSPAAADAAMKLAGLYSRDVADSLHIAPPHTQQVSLKVQIIEVDRSKLDQLGFNLFGIGSTTGNSTTGQFPAIASNSTNSSSSSTSSSGGNALTNSLLALTDPLNFLIYNSAVGIGATRG